MPVWAWALLLWLAFSIPIAVMLGKSIREADRVGKRTMVRYPESRFERRRKARQEARAIEERRAFLDPDKQEKHPLGDPRIGNDRRQKERRMTVMTAAEVEDWLKRNGISTGDRRHNDRRQGDRRR